MQRIYLSFGAGVQSTALALLALNKDPRLLDVTDGGLPSAALFADTGDEREGTYLHVWRMAPLFVRAGVLLEVVRRRGEVSLSSHVLRKSAAGEGSISLPPLFLDTGSAKGRGMALRGCTRDFKARPLDRRAKALFDASRASPVEQWIGISRDEVERMRDSDKGWKTIRYPLVWMGWNRTKCAEYVAEQLYADGDPIYPGRSACVFCPFHHAREWRSVQSHDGDWNRAIDFDESLRRTHEDAGHIAGLRGVPYMTTELLPLKDCTFESSPGQVDMFGSDCLGLCGV